VGWLFLDIWNGATFFVRALYVETFATGFFVFSSGLDCSFILNWWQLVHMINQYAIMNWLRKRFALILVIECLECTFLVRSIVSSTRGNL